MFEVLNITQQNAGQWNALLLIPYVLFTGGMFFFMARQYSLTASSYRQQFFSDVRTDDLQLAPSADNSSTVITAQFKNYGNIVAKDFSVKYRWRIWHNNPLTTSGWVMQCEGENVAVKSHALPPMLVFPCALASFRSVHIGYDIPIYVDIEIEYSFKSTDGLEEKRIEVHEMYREKRTVLWTHAIYAGQKLCDRAGEQ